MLKPEELEKSSKEDIDYQKNEGFKSLHWALTHITSETGVWQENYMNLCIEVAEMYYKNGIVCECDADRKRILYGWEDYENE